MTEDQKKAVWNEALSAALASFKELPNYTGPSEVWEDRGAVYRLKEEIVRRISALVQI